MKANANAEAGGLSPNAREGRAWLRTASACSKLLVAADVEHEQDARARIQSVPSLFHALAFPVVAGPFGVPARPGSPPRTTIAGVHRTRRTSPPKHPPTQRSRPPWPPSVSAMPGRASTTKTPRPSPSNSRSRRFYQSTHLQCTLLPAPDGAVSSCARATTTTGPGPLRAYVTLSTKYALEAHRCGNPPSSDAPLTLAPSGSGIARRAPSAPSTL